MKIETKWLPLPPPVEIVVTMTREEASNLMIIAELCGKVKGIEPYNTVEQDRQRLVIALRNELYSKETK